MTLEEAEKAYIEKFGYFSYWMLDGYSDEEIKDTFIECLKTGKKLTIKGYSDEYDY